MPVTQPCNFQAQGVIPLANQTDKGYGKAEKGQRTIPGVIEQALGSNVFVSHYLVYLCLL